MIRFFRTAIIGCLCLIAMQVCAHSEDSPSTDPAFNIMEKICEARNLLEKSKELMYDEKTVSTRGKKVVRGVRNTRRIDHKVLDRQEISLAILDRETGQIIEKRYWLDTEDIIQANRLRTTGMNNTSPDNMPCFHPFKASQDFEVLVNWWNTFNSDLSVKNKRQDNARQYVVIGNKYLIPKSHLGYYNNRMGTKYLNIFYVPYSRALHSEAMIDAGKSFLNQQVAQAFADLKERQVKSRAYSEQLATDTMSEDFIKCLLINEHSDPGWMLSADAKSRWVAERFLILLAANGEKAFRFTDSRTGALGIAQIMPETYAHVVDLYPDAGLIRDAEKGCTEMANAIKASILVCDDLQTAVVRSSCRQKRYQKLFDAKSEDEIDEIRAAIYNGGPRKYILATGSISPRIRETVYFVKKFNLIKDLHLFE